MDYSIENNQKNLIKRFIIVYFLFFFINLLIEIKILFKIHYLSISFFITIVPNIILVFCYFRVNLLMKIPFRLLVNTVSVILFLFLYITDILFFFPFTISHIIFYLAFPSGFYIVNTLKQTIIYTAIITVLLVSMILFCIHYSDSINIFIFQSGTSDSIRIIRDTLPIIVTVSTILLHYFYMINKVKIESYLESKSNLRNLSIEQSNKTVKEKNLEILYNRIINALESDRLYLDPYFSLDDLTENLNSNKTYISNALNKIGKTNFYEIVNRYRIKDVVNNLDNGNYKAFKIIHLSKKAGFLYQPHFNRAFKKYTGMSPTEYIKSLEKEGK